MGWLGDSSHRGQVCQAWMAVGLPPQYPPLAEQLPANRTLTKSISIIKTPCIVHRTFLQKLHHLSANQPDYLHKPLFRTRSSSVVTLARPSISFSLQINHWQISCHLLVYVMSQLHGHSSRYTVLTGNQWSTADRQTTWRNVSWPNGCTAHLTAARWHSMCITLKWDTVL